ncbi:MAG: hypothetical protein RR351_04320, partial [Christensenella sp.]
MIREVRNGLSIKQQMGGMRNRLYIAAKNVQSGTDNIIRKEVIFMRIMVDNLAVDVENKLVRRGEEDIRLTAKEYEVLKYLALHKDKVVS